MNNFKRFITICVLGGLFGSSINVKAAKSSLSNAAQPSEQSKAILSNIKTMVSTLSIDEAKAIYMEDMEQVVQKMNMIIADIDWTGFIEAAKNQDNNLAAQELTKMMQKILAPFSVSCERELVQAVCLSRIEKQDSEVLLKITNAKSQCFGQFFAELTNQEPVETEEDAKQFITNVVSTSVEELNDSMLAATRSILYPEN